jgi:AcrR family transcriptional regulator
MDRRVKRTREAILNAILSLITEKDYHKISISEVARRADIDRKTFYLHYNGVEQVLVEFSENMVTNLHEKLVENGYFLDPSNLELLYKGVNAIVSERVEVFRNLANSRNFDTFWVSIDNFIVSNLSDAFMQSYHYDRRRAFAYAQFITGGAKSVYKSWLLGEIDAQISELPNNFHVVRPLF